MTIIRTMLRQAQLPTTTPRHDFVPFDGGLNQTQAPLSVPAGYLRDSQNFEIGVEGMYERIMGYERFDGRDKPSDAVYYTMGIARHSLDVPVPEGAGIITGATSGATAYQLSLEWDLEGSGNAMTLILVDVQGTFQDGEYIIHENGGALEPGHDGHGIASTPAIANSAPSLEYDAIFQAQVADYYREQIEAVPGSGPIRGVFRLGGEVFAVRDSADGIDARFYKATTTGWERLFFGVELYFDTGTAEIAEGVTITGSSSGATATVKRVIVTSGSWSGGDAAGRLVLHDTSGTFNVGDNLQVGGATKAVYDHGPYNIILEPGGRYRTVRYNFTGSAGTQKIYGCDGVNTGFEFDGETYTPIRTGMEADTPSFIAAHKYHLFFAFGASLQHSSIGDPLAWSVITGAAELAVGNTITGIISEYGYEAGGTLIIYSRNAIHALYGTSAEDWQLAKYRDEVGAYPDSIQSVGVSYSVDDRGITTLRSSDAFGNFANATVSQLVQPFLMARKNTITGSCIVRDKNQYRVFFEDATSLYMTMSGTKVRGFMPVKLDHVVTCIDSSESDSGDEEIFFGSTDGYVYQMEKGTSFDGGTIEAYLRTHFIHFKSSRLKKRFRRAVLEVSGDGYAEFSLAYELGYKNVKYHQPGGETKVLDLTASQWDALSWDAFFWDGTELSPSEVALTGSAENISFIIRVDSANYRPIRFSGVNVRYSPRLSLR